MGRIDSANPCLCPNWSGCKYLGYARGVRICIYLKNLIIKDFENDSNVSDDEIKEIEKFISLKDK